MGASGPFCLLVNSPWLLVFALLIFFLSLSFFNLCCWKGIYFSNFSSVTPLFFENLDLVFLCLFFGFIISFHFWFRDLLRELNKKYEILLIFFSIFSFILAWTFISLQIKEFRIMGLSINDSVYSSVFFFLTGLHFFHLLVGLFLLSLFFWGCSFPVKILGLIGLRVTEIHLFYNLQLFYW